MSTKYYRGKGKIKAKRVKRQTRPSMPTTSSLLDDPCKPSTPMINHRLRNKPQTLVTPRLLKQTRRSSLTTPNSVVPLSFKSLNDDAPKAPMAPAELRLSFSREESAMTIMSRASTAHEDKIGISFTTDRSTIVPLTPNSRRSSSNRISKRPSFSVSVNSLNKPKGKKKKKRKRMVVYKDGNAIYKKKVNVGGNVKKKKSSRRGSVVKLSDVTKNSLSVNIIPEIKNCEQIDKKEDILPKLEDGKPIGNESDSPKVIECNGVKNGFSFNLVKEMKRPSNATVENIKNEIPPIIEEELVSPPTYDPIGDGDDNFFMCSNEEILDDVDRSKETGEEAELDKFATDISSLPPLSTRRVNKHKSKTEKSSKNVSRIEKIFKRVEEIAKNSMIRSKVKKSSSNKVIKSEKEAIIEQKVLTKIYYNYDFKTKSKIKQRHRRNRRTVDMSAFAKLERIPTLINWVECTDILSTPAMQMQSKYSNEYTNTDQSSNQRFKPDPSMKLLPVDDEDLQGTYS